MNNKISIPNIEFRRRLNNLVYIFRPCGSINKMPAWKREDIDLWVKYSTEYGWVCVDTNETIMAMPWPCKRSEHISLPPAGEWVSKKEDKSYVYDLVFTKSDI
ncbi:MAG: hypothetical protein AB7R69_05710 [Candidatus Babeliales bacterium]|uniref:Uncharacterized protein n=1 Tax=Candidatus Berkiella aquae TaxID=295108 RepID=A0A0Q9Y9L7_9GAMM|nr:hypothetical protein [Candidatus Berkiella aquae]MCS5712845.1 hypothetical protein [Candidatus Berkiella aquae]